MYAYRRTNVPWLHLLIPLFLMLAIAADRIAGTVTKVTVWMSPISANPSRVFDTVLD